MPTVDSMPEKPDAGDRPGLNRTGWRVSSENPARAAPGYQVALEMRPTLARVTLTGALDESAAEAIGGMISADGPVACRVELITEGVTFATPTAVELLVAIARERHQRGLPPVTLAALSEPVIEAARGAGIFGGPPIHLAEKGI
jgi:hypothetical protein